MSAPRCPAVAAVTALQLTLCSCARSCRESRLSHIWNGGRGYKALVLTVETTGHDGI